MRIHTDSLTEKDIYAAADRAGESVRVEMTQHGSRKRDRAFNVTLSGTSSRKRNTGNYGTAGEDSYWGPDRSHAATWDEWGMFLAELFRRDADAIVPGAYESAEHFRWATGAHYDVLTPDTQHRNHSWRPEGTNVTGSYRVERCRTCDAIRRTVSVGHTFAEIAD